MKAIVYIVTLVVMLVGFDAPAGEVYSVEGFIENKTAWTTDDISERSEFRNIFQVEGKWNIDDNTRLCGILRARREDDLEPESLKEVDLREFYLDHQMQSSGWILGRQQVVWGKADGFRLLDIVNPLELREFILPLYTDSRIPLWMINGEAFWGSGSLQALIVPDIEQNDPAAPGGRFFIPPPLPHNVPFELEAVDQPDIDKPKNWEYGLRWASGWGELTYTINYFRTWTDDPVYFRTLNSTGVLTVSPSIERQTIYGLSADRPVGPFVLRAEATVTPDRFFAVATLDGAGNFDAQKAFAYVFGFDWAIGRGLISGQVFQERVYDAPDTLLVDNRRTYYTVLMRGAALQDKLTLQLFDAYGIDQKDNWIALQGSYALTDDLEIALGYDGFNGPADSLFGQFKEQDRVYLQATWYFL